jgi:2-polyprenyl-3-methyl-5-hydroxy-6-metoxy-1,4-benzoquinol methylase
MGLRHVPGTVVRELAHRFRRPVRMAAGDQRYEKGMQQLADGIRSGGRYHSIDLPDGSVLPGLQSLELLRRRLNLFDLPKDLRGKRVLDIGAWDGWFSFECERRGADVVAADCVAFDSFIEAKNLPDSKVEFLNLEVNELSSRRPGRFDIVLFFGVLYHLRHPLPALEKIVELSTDLALVESFTSRPQKREMPAVISRIRGHL